MHENLANFKFWSFGQTSYKLIRAGFCDKEAFFRYFIYISKTFTPIHFTSHTFLQSLFPQFCTNSDSKAKIGENTQFSVFTLPSSRVRDNLVVTWSKKISFFVTIFCCKNVCSVVKATILLIFCPLHMSRWWCQQNYFSFAQSKTHFHW